MIKNYLSKAGGIDIFEAVPENIGYTLRDYEAGAYIELTDEQMERIQEMQHNDGFDIGSDEVLNLVFPTTYYYFKSGKILELMGVLPASQYNLGETWGDYMNGSFVRLTDDQAEYYLHHKNEPIAAIFSLGASAEDELTEEELLERARKNKLQEIETYDSSDNVNSFTVGGISAWLTPSERANYTTSINAAETLGISELTFYIGETALTVSTEQAKQMLAAVQLYADSCYIVTKQHEQVVSQLMDIESIETYDITADYPDKLVFNI